jgi:hypothetical protein
VICRGYLVERDVVSFTGIRLRGEFEVGGDDFVGLSATNDQLCCR